MARLVVGEDNLMLRLTWLEKVAAFRRSVTVPLAAIESVEVIDKPWNGLLGKEVSMGFAAGSAPGRTLITAGLAHGRRTAER